MTLHEIRRIVESNDSVWEGWWPALQQLNTAQLQRPIVGSYPNILSTLEHAIGAELWWQHRLEDIPASQDPPPLKLFEEVKNRWLTLQPRRMAWIDNADPESIVHLKGDDSGSKTVRTWECIIHITSHSHYHRGQLALQFRQIGLVPPSRDLLAWFKSA